MVSVPGCLWPEKYQQSNTKQYKRNAKPLSHVQGHDCFEIYLVFLDEFDQEAHSKNQDKEPAEKRPGTEFCI